ncbi:hypothetical protein KY348_02175 [Candidatus Woesearchaeota archaeon]|nr:hypothetical protein [Candidatus Woesearchaeota archaeon]
MLRFGILRNSKKQQTLREKKYAEMMEHRLNSDSNLTFDYGLKELFLKPKENPVHTLLDFVKEWNSNPEKKLNYKNFNLPAVSRKQDIIEFPSILDPQDTARFRFVRQPKWRSGHEIAVIILKHWDSEITKYYRGVRFIRRTMLPISTGVYIPSYQELNPVSKKIRQYNILGPNIGLTIKRVWQDVLDIQYFADYLKKEMGFNQVGVFTYSIGSLRGFLSAIFAPELFDFAVLHFIADDFSEAFLKGVSTQGAASVVNKNMSLQNLKKIWSIISPGNYEKYLSRLGKSTRIVQGKYDLVFGQENCARITRKIKKHAPYVQIEVGNFGHITVAEIEKTVPLMIRNLKFIYNNTELKYF